MVAHLQLENLIGNLLRLIEVGGRTDHLNPGSLVILRPHLLGHPVLVVLDDGVGRIHDVLRGTVVLLQLEDARARIVALEIEDVLDVGATETVDALRIVAHHADILVKSRQPLDNQILREVGILILVDEDILEPVLIFEQRLGRIAQEDIHKVEQVVEIHGVRLVQTVVVFGEDLRNHRLVGHPVVGLDFGVVGILLRRQEAGFGHGDTAQHESGGVLLGIQPHLLDDALDQRFGVVRVVDGDVGGESDLLGLHPEDAVEDGVESAHRDRLGQVAADQVHDTLAHLRRGLIGESQRQNPVRTDVINSQHVGDAVGQHTGLTGARTRQNHHRTLGLGHRHLLLLIQFG